MENKYLGILKKETLEILKSEKAKVVVFGSRARKDYKPYSDVDIGIIPGSNFNSGKIAILKDRIDNLNIPYKVEVVNFQEVSDDFRKEALKEVLVWKD